MTTRLFVALVELQLSRLGWLATAAQPHRGVVIADEHLPYGWVRVEDEEFVFAIGDALEIYETLACLDRDDDYGCFDIDCACPNSHTWPSDLMARETLEEGDPNDNPWTLFILGTNGGLRYCAGPHGASYDAIDEEDFHETRVAALADFEKWQREEALCQQAEEKAANAGPNK